jgi:uridine kinase
MRRLDLIEEISSLIVLIERPHPIRVAIDGVDAAGKTALADELAGPIQSRGRAVIRASVDGFHNPRHIRYRLGPDSPEGYYRDSFDYDTLKKILLDPLADGGSLRYRSAAFDYRNDVRVTAPMLQAPQKAVLLFDGIFLHRPELDHCWDLSIFVETSFEVTLERARKRAMKELGSHEGVEEGHTRRYVPGQLLYLDECRPEDRADIIVRNDDLSNPSIHHRSPNVGEPLC